MIDWGICILGYVYFGSAERDGLGDSTVAAGGGPLAVTPLAWVAARPLQLQLGEQLL